MEHYIKEKYFCCEPKWLKPTTSSVGFCAKDFEHVDFNFLHDSIKTSFCEYPQILSDNCLLFDTQTDHDSPKFSSTILNSIFDNDPPDFILAKESFLPWDIVSVIRIQEELNNVYNFNKIEKDLKNILRLSLWRDEIIGLVTNWKEAYLIKIVQEDTRFITYIGEFFSNIDESCYNIIDNFLASTETLGHVDHSSYLPLYEFSEFVATGGTSVVLKMKNNSNNNNYVDDILVKFFTFGPSSNQHECNILKILESSPYNKIILYDYSTNYFATTTIGEQLPENWFMRRDYFVCLLNQIQFAHEQNIVHRDIRKGNIIFYNTEPLLIDWGFAIFQDHRYQYYNGSISTYSYRLLNENTNNSLTIVFRYIDDCISLLQCILFELPQFKIIHEQINEAINLGRFPQNSLRQIWKRIWEQNDLVFEEYNNLLKEDSIYEQTLRLYDIIITQLS